MMYNKRNRLDQTVLYKNNGDDRYPDFKLYKMISRCVHNHTPQSQLERKEFNKFLISNNIKLAIKLNLDGAYIPSFNKDKKHLSYSVRKKFIILGSAHNIYEMRTKELQHVNAIFLSSIFKKNKNYLGINKFKSLSLLSNKPFIALGGISVNNLKKLALTDCHGFAGISFFE